MRLLTLSRYYTLYLKNVSAFPSLIYGIQINTNIKVHKCNTPVAHMLPPMYYPPLQIVQFNSIQFDSQPFSAWA